MTTIQLVLLAILAACIMSSGFLSGSETAMVAVPRERIVQLTAAGRRGRRLGDLLEDLDRTIGTLLVANNFVNILGASIATTLAIDLVGETWGPWLSTGVITAIILVVGEITPKTLAARYPDRFAMFVAPTIWWLARILDPVSKVFLAISRVVLRLFGVRVEEHHQLITEEDIRALAVLGEEAGEIEAEEREIIEALFHLADRPIRDVMTPRPDVVYLEEPVTIEKVRQVVAETAHSRYPVVPAGGTLDELLGILYVKDVFRAAVPLGPDEIRRLYREPYFLPETTTVLRALQEMRRRRLALAVVLDEHGGVEGLVTMKDLISELIGEIPDEYDPGIPAITRIDERTWIVDGRVTVEDLAEAVGVDLPDGPYSTVAGLFLHVAGVIPRPGDAVEVDGVRLVVMDMDKLRIEKVRVERLAGSPTPPEG